MRSFRLPLSVKYRILFGLAVILIVAAALYVPWYRMEALALEQSFREAQRAADDHFRLVLGNARHDAMPGTISHAGEALTGVSAGHSPRFVPLRADYSELPDGAPIPGLSDAAGRFAGKAFLKFVRDSKRTSTYGTEAADEGRRFLYAHAVRVGKSCLACHDETKAAKVPLRDSELAGLILVNLPADQTDKEMLFNRMFIVAAGLLAGALAILVFYVITRNFILSPIHELREVAIRVTHGDLSVRSTVDTGDEFQQLSDNLNTMLERLRVSQEDLRKANFALDQRLGEMTAANTALDEANRVKNQFLANVTHELRTPLTSILGFAELLQEGPASGNGKNTRYAENIMISGRILLEIIDDLLDLAKIEAGKIDLTPEPIALHEFCQTLVEFARPLADKKSLDLTLEATSDLPQVQSDAGRLRQVLFNLISNAIKFTPEGGSVGVVAFRRSDSEVQIEVRDNGPGISPEHQSIIFDKFRQIDGSATREHAGAGLGLAIAKELIEKLGGQIGVISQPGAGATFWVRLPAGAAEPATESSPPAAD